MMYDHGQSDSPVDPAKFPNKAGRPAAEGMEGRGWPKGTEPAHRAPGTGPGRRAQCAGAGTASCGAGQAGAVHDAPAPRLPHRPSAPGLPRAEAGGGAGDRRRDVAALRGGLGGEPPGPLGTAGARGVSSEAGQAGVHRQGRRRQRPLGIPTLEDKLVQRTTVEVLNTIYETDFLGFSYGFRPGRSPHDALDALYAGLLTKKVNWVLDADIRGFFEAIDHGWLVKFVEHRIADRRVVRLIQKWLKAGVLEDGKRTWRGEGTPRGPAFAPPGQRVLALRVRSLGPAVAEDAGPRRRDRRPVCGRFHRGIPAPGGGRAVLGRAARASREVRVGAAPREDTTAGVRAHAAERRRRAGEGKPETFDFLGFTHICGKKRNGRFTVVRQTIRKRLQAKLHEVKAELRRRLHDPISQVGTWLGQVVGGHTRITGCP